jgi:hypothetical protein
VSLAAVAAAAALAAGQPPPEPVEPTAKHPIVVDGTTISRGHLRHWAEIAAANDSGSSRRDHRGLAAALLISARWIRLEAAELGIELNRGAVTRTFKRQRDASFKTRRDFRVFLRASGQSVRDIRFRIQVDLLSNRIRRHATEGATTPEEQQRRLEEFVARFHSKWRARTDCRPPWVAEADCGGA